MGIRSYIRAFWSELWNPDSKAWQFIDRILFVLLPLIILATTIPQIPREWMGIMANLMWILPLSIWGLYFLIVVPYRLASKYKRELNKARDKIEQHEQAENNPNSKYYDQNAEKATLRHWEALTLLCQEVADRMTVPFSIDNRYSLLSRELGNYDDGIKELNFIRHWELMDEQAEEEAEKNTVNQREKADWGLYGYLHTHIKTEDSEWEVKMLTLKEAVICLHNNLYTLTRMASGITKEWTVIFTEKDWPIEAGEQTPHLKALLKPMEQDVMQSYNVCMKAIMPIRIKLGNIAKRRTFKGRCPACP